MRYLLLVLRTNLVAENIRQTVVAAEPSLADSRVLASLTRVDPGDAAPALRPGLAEPAALAVAVLGTDLGTERGGTEANKRDRVKQA